MTKISCCFFALTLFAVCGVSMAQSYEFGPKKGYIFDQKYVKRISVKQAEQVLGSPGLIEDLLSSYRGEEAITDSRVKRTGDRLILRFNGRPPLSLRDFIHESTAQNDGDSQQFKYIKSVSGHHVVVVSFGHDAPAILFAPYAGEQIYFVNND